MFLVAEGRVLCVDLKAFQEYSNLQQKLKDAEAATQVLSSTPQVGLSQQTHKFCPPLTFLAQVSFSDCPLSGVRLSVCPSVF
jgi:hypothetical protein